MPKNKKPSATPKTPFPAKADDLHRDGNWLWIPLRKEWRDVTNKPEEIVRQRFIRTLVDHYDYTLEQMIESKGSGSNGICIAVESRRSRHGDSL